MSGLLASGCTARTAPEPAACVAPSISTAGWVTVSGSELRLRLPAAYRAVAVDALDSEVREWADDAHQLSYDYGYYSNPLDQTPSLVSRRECGAIIGQHPVRVVIGRDSTGRYVVAAHWPTVRKNGDGVIRLTMYGTASDSMGREELRAAIWTLQFDKQ